MLQKLFILIMVGIFCNHLNFGSASGMPEIPAFFDVDWASIPTCKVTEYDVMNLFVGPVEIGGREWTMSNFNNDEFRAVIADRQFDVKVFDEEDTFAHQKFRVDSKGYIQYRFAIVSRTKCFDATDEDEGKPYSLCSILTVSTKLTEEELDNPIIQYMQSELSFEEMNALHSRKPHEFEATIGLEEANKLLAFLKPELHAEALEALEAFRKEVEDAAAESSKK